VRDGAAELVTPDGLRGMLESDPGQKLVVGDWETIPTGTLRGLHGVKMGRPRFPAAAALIEIARGYAERDDFPHPDEVRPNYMRDPDIRINWTDFRREAPWSS